MKTLALLNNVTVLNKISANKIKGGSDTSLALDVLSITFKDPNGNIINFSGTKEQLASLYPNGLAGSTLISVSK
jgi:hypothetical protein